MCLHCWALDGLIVVLVGFPRVIHGITRLFDPVHIDDQVLVPKYSPNGRLVACWFDDDSQIYSFNFGLRIWDVADLTTKYQIHWIYVARHDDEPLFQVPVKNKKCLYASPFKVVIEGSVVERTREKGEVGRKSVGVRNQGTSCPELKCFKVFK